MEAYIWVILVSMLAVGLLIGFVVGRGKGDISAPRVRELEAQLNKADKEMQLYREDVSQHFEKTATLFNQLTHDYRSVYEHLASSSEKLCGDQVAKLKDLTSDNKVLESPDEKTDTVAGVDTPSTSEITSSTEKKTRADDNNAETTSAVETTEINQQTDEARTIH